MILEGIVTTRNVDGSTNIAPMGPLVEDTMASLLLRPYQTSTTYQNLKRTGAGVFHVVDDVLLLAEAAVGAIENRPEMQAATLVEGDVLTDACRWYEFEVARLDDAQERTEILGNVVHAGRLRDFFGFNRAKHAVLEAAILATRLHLLPRDQIVAELERLRVPVDKTAGPRERAAFQLLVEYIRTH